jgi:trans-2,3-dihydro-3-hydroxyanthranilate isomerase
MKATISWWDLTDSDQNIETLRKYLQNDGVKPWSPIKGLLLKFWISDPTTNRWGAVMLWDSNVSLDTPLPPNEATKLIGYPPTDRMVTDIEAIVGSLLSSHLTDLGLAFNHKDPS